MDQHIAISKALTTRFKKSLTSISNPFKDTDYFNRMKHQYGKTKNGKTRNSRWFQTKAIFAALICCTSELKRCLDKRYSDVENVYYHCSFEGAGKGNGRIKNSILKAMVQQVCPSEYRIPEKSSIREHLFDFSFSNRWLPEKKSEEKWLKEGTKMLEAGKKYRRLLVAESELDKGATIRDLLKLCLAKSSFKLFIYPIEASGLEKARETDEALRQKFRATIKISEGYDFTNHEEWLFWGIFGKWPHEQVVYAHRIQGSDFIFEVIETE